MVKSIPQADIGMVQPCGSRLAADECCPLSEDSDQRLELSEPWMENGLITVLHEATHDLGVIQETFMTVLRHALNGMKVCRTPTALTDWTWGGGDHGCPSERADRGSSAEPSDNQPIDKGPRYQYIVHNFRVSLCYRIGEEPTRIMPSSEPLSSVEGTLRFSPMPCRSWKWQSGWISERNPFRAQRYIRKPSPKPRHKLQRPPACP